MDRKTFIVPKVLKQCMPLYEACIIQIDIHGKAFTVLLKAKV